MTPVRTYEDFTNKKSITEKVRAGLRKSFILASARVSNKTFLNGNWIQFPYYHHVFDDEKLGFERQLKFLSNYGEFISMDQSLELLKEPSKIDGRYFCVGFDDGFSSCGSNMVEVTESLDIPVIVFLPTSFVGFYPEEDNLDMLSAFKNSGNPPMDFLSWLECKDLLSRKVSFGSHTVSHVPLKELTDQQLKYELKQSKQEIEEKLDIECIHFACPWGRPNIDFDVNSIKEIMIECGYQSFSTTERGVMSTDFSNPYHIRRDHLLANWENFQLKYFLLS